MNSIKFMQL